MRGNKAVKVILKKMLSYCDDVSGIIESGHVDREEFEQNHTVQLACGMCIIQIGELVSRLDDSFISEHPEIEWRKIKGMRNIYAHDYDMVDNDTVWVAIRTELPELKNRIQRILETIAEDDAI